MKRAPSKRHLEDAKLRIAIRTADTKTRSTYGAKRLQDELADDGILQEGTGLLGYGARRGLDAFKNESLKRPPIPIMHCQLQIIY